jgi:hypothetical protein
MRIQKINKKVALKFLDIINLNRENNTESFEDEVYSLIYDFIEEDYLFLSSDGYYMATEDLKEEEVKILEELIKKNKIQGFK